MRFLVHVRATIVPCPLPGYGGEVVWLRTGADEGAHVSRGRAREFWCEVVSEAVMIRLKRNGGFGRVQGYFVQCNQLDCQYVEENKPPCPLHVGLFADEIRAAEEARATRRAEDEG
jgi:hypothetical protein